MEDAIKNIKESFRKVAYQFDALRETNALGMSEAFIELETALSKFDMNLDYFLQEIEEEK